jgi:hypothetical protein
VIHFNIAEPKIYNSVVTKSEVGDVSKRKWDMLLEDIFESQVRLINLQYRNGIDLGKVIEELEYLKGTIPNTTLSPSVHEEFFYIGYKLPADK